MSDAQIAYLLLLKYVLCCCRSQHREAENDVKVALKARPRVHRGETLLNL